MKIIPKLSLLQGNPFLSEALIKKLSRNSLLTSHDIPGVMQSLLQFLRIDIVS